MSDFENLIHMYEKMDLPVKKMMAQLNRQQ